MALRFEDHAGFERTCLIAAAGGALAAGYATSITPPADLVPWAAAGAVFALGVAVRWEELPPVPCIAAAALLAAGAVYAAPSLLPLTEILIRLLKGHSQGVSFATLFTEANIVRRLRRALVASVLSGHRGFSQRPDQPGLWFYDESYVISRRRD